jgi:hypothetical protein
MLNDTSTITDDFPALSFAQRRMWLNGKNKECPDCGDASQQQLTFWTGEPAEWRCRLCKKSYSFEPNYISNQ